MKKILWLTSWYPNRLEPLSGDFIERHAKAASLHHNITVIHIVKDHAGVTSGDSFLDRIDYPDYPNLTAYVGYYKSNSNVFGSLLSLVKYLRFQRRLIKNYIKDNGRPDLINVHIGYKAGLGALYCKSAHKVNYIISEQWTIFCPEARPAFKDQSLIARWLMKKIYRNASATTAVSEYLATSLSQQFGIEKPTRIPNVVDHRLFHPAKNKHRRFTFIHISTLNYQKNPEAIVEAVALLKTKTSKPFLLLIYGPIIPTLQDFILAQGLADVVEYRGEVPQDVLAAEVRRCHALVLYSRFETFGCVIIEAMAAGLPVVVSDIPVMREIVEENVNGIFAAQESPKALAEKMLWMMDNYHRFNTRSIIEKTISLYSFEKVAAMFDETFRRSSSPTQERLRQG